MKKLCFIILISFIFGITNLPKYGSIQMSSEKGIFYLTTSDFDEGSPIYFQFNVDNGGVHSEIIYEFSDTYPTSFSFKNPSTTKNYGSGQSQTVVNGRQSYTLKYYYEVKNDRSKNYLYVQYSQLSGNYVEIENTKYSIGFFILMIILSIFGGLILICIIVIIVICVCIKKSRRNVVNYTNYTYNNNNVPQNQNLLPNENAQTQTQTPTQNPDYYNSNYPQQQQQPPMYYQQQQQPPMNYQQAPLQPIN